MPFEFWSWRMKLGSQLDRGRLFDGGFEVLLDQFGGRSRGRRTGRASSRGKPRLAILDLRLEEAVRDNERLDRLPGVSTAGSDGLVGGSLQFERCRSGWLPIPIH